MKNKKYYLKHKFLNDGNWFSYLNWQEGGEHYYLYVDTEREGIKTQFTQAEIEKLKEKYSTDLRDFEIIEVKNGKDNI